jgi:superfamily II DNA/RNA helicase
MENFNALNLHPALLQALTRMNYNTPTDIQAQAIPHALAGRDILGSAQTGTGKTAAFAIPLVNKLLNSPNGSALVLTPTRELARQIMDVMHQMVGRNNRDIPTAFLIGGESMGKQFAQLRGKPRLIVGTPGRINDHLERKNLRLDDASFLVLDETDRMLDMGFGVQIDRIVAHLPKPRQTLLFSATLPSGIVKLSQKYLSNPQRVAVGSTTATAINIKQEMLYVDEAEKYDELLRQLGDREGSVIIFVKTKYGTERLAKKLVAANHSADSLHGGLKQSQRDRATRGFREKKFRVLVATDVAARGLDIPHIEHVINYDLPQCPEDYIHRIGRTARAGAQGSSLCLVIPQERGKWRMIERLLSGDESGSSSEPMRKGGGGNGGGNRNAQDGERKQGGFRDRKKNNSFRRGRNGGSNGGDRKERGSGKPSHGKPAHGKPARAKSGQGKPSHGRSQNQGKKWA